MDIKEGHWGIYTKSEEMPVERFDPFRTIINDYGTKVGYITQFSPLRSKRPFEHLDKNNGKVVEKKSKEDDSFCKIVKGELPAIVITEESKKTKDPLSIEAEKKELTDLKALSIVNLFTPMARVLYNNTKSIEKISEKSVGVGLVHLLTKHYDTLSEIPKEEIFELLKTTKTAHLESIKVLKERYQTEKLTLLHFFNIGEEAGASICHLHSQTYIYANDIGHGWTSLGFLSVPQFYKKLKKDENYCLACEMVKKKEELFDPLGQNLNIEKRMVFENNEWIVITAYSPERDGQLRLIPKKHISKFANMNENQLYYLAEALKVANIALDEFVRKVDGNLHLLQDRNILFRQENEGYDSKMHLLIDIIPIQRIGGAEIMESYRIATLFPEQVAEIMKNALETLI
ncbi:MAG: hypothetical protein ACTSSG_09255 [Candidatus Heimdallarchaeaceae archaeon]